MNCLFWLLTSRKARVNNSFLCCFFYVVQCCFVMLSMLKYLVTKKKYHCYGNLLIIEFQIHGLGICFINFLWYLCKATAPNSLTLLLSLSLSLFMLTKYKRINTTTHDIYVKFQCKYEGYNIVIENVQHCRWRIGQIEIWYVMKLFHGLNYHFSSIIPTMTSKIQTKMTR